MQLSPWQASSPSARQEIPHSLWNAKVHCHIHNSPLLIFILSQNDPIHTIPSCWRSIPHCSLIHALVFQVVSPLLFPPPKPCMHHFPHTPPIHLPLSPVSSSLLGPSTFLSTLFLITLSLCSSFNVRYQVSHPHTTRNILVLSNSATFTLILSFNVTSVTVTQLVKKLNTWMFITMFTTAWQWTYHMKPRQSFWLCFILKSTMECHKLSRS